MKILVSFAFLYFLFQDADIQVRELNHNGSNIKTTFHIDDAFYGKYKGTKEGYLILHKDGTGIYRYDYPGLSQSCQGTEIWFDWGFVIDEAGQIVRFERPYGSSYPVIYNCTGENGFKGCTERTMVDYIMVYDDGSINVSSSDDWTKTKD